MMVARWEKKRHIHSQGGLLWGGRGAWGAYGDRRKTIQEGGESEILYMRTIAMRALDRGDLLTRTASEALACRDAGACAPGKSSGGRGGVSRMWFSTDVVRPTIDTRARPSPPHWPAADTAAADDAAYRNISKQVHYYSNNRLFISTYTHNIAGTRHK